MSPKIQFYFRLFIVIGALAGFVWMFAVAFQKTYRAAGEPPVFNEPFTIAATTLAGLVGGVAAIGLGTSLPEKLKLSVKNKIMQHFLAFGIQLAPHQEEVIQIIMAAVYAGIYLLVGVMAWILWISRPTLTPALVKDLAGIVLGLGVAVVQSFFGVQTIANRIKNRG